MEKKEQQEELLLLMIVRKFTFYQDESSKYFPVVSAFMWQGLTKWTKIVYFFFHNPWVVGFFPQRHFVNINNVLFFFTVMDLLVNLPWLEDIRSPTWPWSLLNSLSWLWNKHLDSYSLGFLARWHRRAPRFLMENGDSEHEAQNSSRRLDSPCAICFLSWVFLLQSPETRSSEVM